MPLSMRIEARAKTKNY